MKFVCNIYDYRRPDGLQKAQAYASKGTTADEILQKFLDAINNHIIGRPKDCSPYCTTKQLEAVGCIGLYKGE